MADIKEMSVEEIMNELSDRAVEAGAIDSQCQLALLMLKRMMPENRRSIGGAVDGSNEIFIDLEDAVCGLDIDPSTKEMLKKANTFGIGYLNGY